MADIKRTIRELSTTIANGATESSAVELRQFAGGGYSLPSSYDGTAITFKVCDDESGTYQALYDQYGNQVSVVTAASRSFALPSELFGWPWFKFVAGTSQTGDTTITVVLAG